MAAPSAPVDPAPPWTRSRLMVASGGLIAVAVAAVAWGSVILPNESFAGIDAFYHFRLAELMGAGELWRDIDWLPFTILGEHGADHHWLWHVLLIPFTWVADDFEGLKLASVVTATAVVAAAWATARAFRVPAPAIVAPLVAWAAVVGTAIVPGRLAQVRAQSFALPCMFVALWALARGRHVLLGVVAFLFMQGYHGAVILAPLVALHVVLVAAHERRFAWRPIAAAAAGGLAGLALSPWFPGNVEYLLFHTLYKVGNAEGMAVGSEWMAPSWTFLMADAWPALALLVPSATLALLVRRGRLSRDGWLWLMTALMMLALTKSAWRFAEYFAPMAALAAGVAVRDVADAWARRPEGRPSGAPVLAGVALVVALGVTSAAATRGLGLMARQAEFVPTKYEAISEVLAEHAEAGDVVFNTNWTDFVFLMWHQPELRYVAGLDPHYLAYADRARFDQWRWVSSATSSEPNDPAALARTGFDARWLVASYHQAPLARRLLASPHARLVATSPWGYLFHLEIPQDREGGAERARPPEVPFVLATGP